VLKAHIFFCVSFLFEFYIIYNKNKRDIHEVKSRRIIRKLAMSNYFVPKDVTIYLSVNARV